MADRVADKEPTKQLTNMACLVTIVKDLREGTTTQSSFLIYLCEKIRQVVFTVMDGGNRNERYV
jgi:hypothetical protein